MQLFLDFLAEKNGYTIFSIEKQRWCAGLLVVRCADVLVQGLLQKLAFLLPGLGPRPCGRRFLILPLLLIPTLILSLLPILIRRLLLLLVLLLTLQVVRFAFDQYSDTESGHGQVLCLWRLRGHCGLGQDQDAIWCKTIASGESKVFGKGAYASCKSPIEFGLRENILLSNYMTQIIEDDNHDHLLFRRRCLNICKYCALSVRVWAIFVHG